MSEDVHTTAPAPAEVPSQVRAAAAIIGLEALGLVAAAVVLLVKIITGHPDSLVAALLETAMALGGAALLAASARGLLHLRPSSRAPVMVLQLLALPVGYSLAFQAGLVAYGGPILLAALGTLYLLFTPPAREALDRGGPSDAD